MRNVRRVSLWLLALSTVSGVPAAGADRVEDLHDGEGMDEEASIRSEPFGGLAAMGPTPVVLAAAALTWTDRKGEHTPVLSARIAYRFRNAGPAREQRVAIRATWTNEETPLSAPRPSTEGVLPPVVRIDGAPFECALEAPEWRPWGPGKGWGSGVETWCVGRLVFPPGESTRLVEYEAATVSRAHYWTTIRRGFEAEATWAGRMETLDATLSLSLLAASPVIVGPVPFVERDGVVTWHLTSPEPGALAPIYVGMDTRRWAPTRLRVASRGYVFAASSRLGPERGRRYDPDRALDGDGSTAWCEGVPGPGVGEWIEVRPRLDPELAARCWLVGFAVIPGLTGSTRIWLANNRVERFRIASCSHPDEHVDFDLATLEDEMGRPVRLAEDPREGGPRFAQVTFEGEALHLAGTRTGAFDRERECFRLTILGVRKGRVDDSCIGEFLPIVSCAEQEHAYPVRAVR